MPSNLGRTSPGLAEIAVVLQIGLSVRSLRLRHALVRELSTLTRDVRPSASLPGIRRNRRAVAFGVRAGCGALAEGASEPADRVALAPRHFLRDATQFGPPRVEVTRVAVEPWYWDTGVEHPGAALLLVLANVGPAMARGLSNWSAPRPLAKTPQSGSLALQRYS